MASAPITITVSTPRYVIKDESALQQLGALALDPNWERRYQYSVEGLVNLSEVKDVYQLIELSGYRIETFQYLADFTAHEMSLWQRGYLFVIDGGEEKLQRGIQKVWRVLERQSRHFLIPPPVKHVDGTATINLSEFRLRQIFREKAYLDTRVEIIYAPVPTPPGHCLEVKFSVVSIGPQTRAQLDASP
jgi:hypothetical protein